LAALALRLARAADNERANETAVANCANALAAVLAQIRQLAPASEEEDKVDDLAARRRARLGRRAAAKD
jgi:hypothetical protein